MMIRIAALSTLFVLVAQPSRADSVEKALQDNTPETQMESFEVTPGYSVNLFASEDLGIANPICFNWDYRNRLWVLCSLVYPQLVPTEKTNDKLFILEDTDRDGVADKSTVFAGGLNMPTGFALGDGGVYIGEGSELVFLADEDGDDRADSRRVLLAGFGTGDTHQNINSFTWSPDGELYFCQGLHAFSRVETPWGISRLDEHGVWRMQPRRLRLFPFRGVAGQNPWGVSFGPWGEGLVKGNGTTLCELTPHAIPTDNRPSDLVVGATQIKSMIALHVDSPHLPDSIQGDVLIAGYYAHVIDRMQLFPDGSGHRTLNRPPLFRTDYPSFRPVDLKIGPDGAIYVADWYNPIIGHYQASLRHPDRDKEHGRIWRITFDDAPPSPYPSIAGLPIDELVSRLSSPIRYERDRVRERLSAFPSDQVIPELEKWIAGNHSDRTLYEAAAVHAWHEAVSLALLQRLISAETPGTRAFGARLTGRWADRLESPEQLLSAAVNDPHPRVRLEGIIGCGYLESAEGVTIALQALEHPSDRFIRRALNQVCLALKQQWLPRFTDLEFGRSAHLAFALRSAGADATEEARKLLPETEPGSELESAILLLLADSPNPGDQLTVLSLASRHPAVIEALCDASEVHGRRPGSVPLDHMKTLLSDPNPKIRKSLIRLSGIWKVRGLVPELRSSLEDADRENIALAIGSLSTILGEDFTPDLEKWAVQSDTPAILEAAFSNLVRLSPESAAHKAAARLSQPLGEAVNDAIITSFAQQKNSLPVLGTELASFEIPEKNAIQIRSTLGGAGIYSREIATALGSPDSRAIGMPQHSVEWISELVTEVKKSGDSQSGKEVFHRAELSCVACHQAGQAGGMLLGPELTAVGAGLPLDLIVEAILWPARQVKEGYLSTSLVLKDGSNISGYVQSENPRLIVIRNAVNGQSTTLLKRQIETRHDAGTLMPPGLTASLTRKELVDLVAYLATLKG